ncbi:MAG TPA: AmmeMemoRadiSam system protein B [Armatimonadota bacterium]|nr:AmmeMemoRadiSam system protein B [Armatimonadota bacterium]
MAIRPADRAGSWYPAGTTSCETRLRAMLDAAAAALPAPAGEPMAGIAPHAGWDFSGPTAALTFGFLQASDAQVVALFGADHYGLRNAALMSSGTWQTPVGEVRVDVGLGRAILEEAGRIVADDPEAHFDEHSIEILMPFVRHCFPEATVVPIIVPRGAPATEIGDAVGRVLAGSKRRAVAVGSTDLTHYGPNYGFAPRGTGAESLEWVRNENDRRFLDLAEAMRATELVSYAEASRAACGARAAAAAIACGQALGATRGMVLGHTTSHDVLPLGRPTSFVGYGAVGYLR